MEQDLEEMRELLFMHDHEAFIIKVMAIVEDMSNSLTELSAENIASYSSGIKSVLDSMKQGDYLTASDIILYDLYPLFT